MNACGCGGPSHQCLNFSAPVRQSLHHQCSLEPPECRGGSCGRQLAYAGSVVTCRRWSPRRGGSEQDLHLVLLAASCEPRGEQLLLRCAPLPRPCLESAAEDRSSTNCEPKQSLLPESGRCQRLCPRDEEGAQTLFKVKGCLAKRCVLVFPVPLPSGGPT